MEDFLHQYFQTASLWMIALAILGSFFILAFSADVLVEKTVALSLQWGIPSMIVSATIVSLGTTLPEVSVSVSAALDGDPGLALGNAVGSIITDSSLILGIALLIHPTVIDRTLMKRQGLFQIGSAILLVAASFIFIKKGVNPFQQGGFLPQGFGFLLVALLVFYILYSIYSSKKSQAAPSAELTVLNKTPSILIFFQLILSVAFVVISSKTLIPALTELAVRIKIPASVIGATLVAFGTSLPELITAITSARKGHTEIAVGNVLGADVLNVLSVTGISLAATRDGFTVGPEFFRIFFPSMLLILIVFQLSAFLSKNKPLGRTVGLIFLTIYSITTALGYISA